MKKDLSVVLLDDTNREAVVIVWRARIQRN